MDIKEIDESIHYIQIIFSLFDGKQKSAGKIAKEWKNIDKDTYKKKCEYLVEKKMLMRHKIKNRKGHAYSLNFDSFIKQFDQSIQIYGKEYLLKKFKEKPISEFVSFFVNDVKLKTGDYALFILHINLYLSNALMLDVAWKFIDKLINKKNSVDRETQEILKRMKKFLDNKMSKRE